MRRDQTEGIRSGVGVRGNIERGEEGKWWGTRGRRDSGIVVERRERRKEGQRGKRESVEERGEVRVRKSVVQMGSLRVWVSGRR